MSITYDHVALRVTDLDAAISFCRDLLELELVSRSETGSQSVFKVGTELLVLFCREANESVPDGTSFGTDHVAFCLEGDHYERVLGRLRKDEGVLRGPTVNKGAQGDGLATYFRDPDGNELEIKTYDPGVIAAQANG